MFADYGDMGGTRTYAKQLLSFYVRNQFNVTFLAQGPMNDSDMEVFCKNAGVTYIYYKKVALFVNRFNKLPIRTLLEFISNIFLIALYKPDLIAATVSNPGRFFGHLLFGKKSIYILHTIPGNKITMPTFKRIVRDFIWQSLIPGNCTFVTVSEYCKAKMKETWKLSAKQEPEVIFNSTGEEVYVNKPNSLTIEVLTVGHVVDYKNPLLWIEIASRVIDVYPSIRFTWLGNGPLLDICKKRVSVLGLSNKIYFPGKLNDLHPFYACCDIYLHLSENENLSLAILDAMRYGKPCIVSDVGGSPELVVNNHSGYVLKLVNGTENIVSHIVKLSQRSNIRNEMGYNARNRYRDHFSPNLWEKRMLDLHASVMS